MTTRAAAYHYPGRIDEVSTQEVVTTGRDWLALELTFGRADVLQAFLMLDGQPTDEQVERFDNSLLIFANQLRHSAEAIEDYATRRQAKRANERATDNAAADKVNA